MDVTIRYYPETLFHSATGQESSSVTPESRQFGDAQKRMKKAAQENDIGYDINLVWYTPHLCAIRMTRENGLFMGKTTG